MQQRGGGIREHFLGFVDLGALQLFKSRDLAHRQDREQF
jgi:hypothetical protein